MRAKTLNPDKVEIKMAILKTTPIRAANILGPALICFEVKSNAFIVCLDILEKGLYFDNSAERKMKSNNKNTIIKISDDNT